jgi:hypothetical protein
MDEKEVQQNQDEQQNQNQANKNQQNQSDELTEQMQQAVRVAMIEAAKSIINMTNLTSIKEQLSTLPGQIRLQKQTVSELSRAAKEAQIALGQEEAILAAAISVEIDPKTGKAKYSNQAARDAELAIRKKSSAAINEAERIYKILEANLNEAQFKLEELQDQFRAVRILARIACTEIALLGGDNLEEADSDVY